MVLKILKNDKSATKRKKQGIEAVKKILKDKPHNLSFLEGHKKRMIYGCYAGINFLI